MHAEIDLKEKVKIKLNSIHLNLYLILQNQNFLINVIIFH